jgi:hypothetical protein
VDEARAMKAAAVVMPISGQGAGLGRTVETVLRERPTRVILETTPQRADRRAGVAA